MKELLGMLLHSYESYTIIYKGAIYSNNDAQSKAWQKRAGIVTKYKTMFGWLLKEAKLPWFEQFALVCYYNSRHDCDNISSTCKILIDSMKQIEKKGVITQKGYSTDDSKKYYKMLAILPDDSLDTNTFKFQLIKLK